MADAALEGGVEIGGVVATAPVWVDVIEVTVVAIGVSGGEVIYAFLDDFLVGFEALADTALGDRVEGGGVVVSAPSWVDLVVFAVISPVVGS